MNIENIKSVLSFTFKFYIKLHIFRKKSIHTIAQLHSTLAL